MKIGLRGRGRIGFGREEGSEVVIGGRGDLAELELTLLVRKGELDLGAKTVKATSLATVSVTCSDSA